MVLMFIPINNTLKESHLRVSAIAEFFVHMSIEKVEDATHTRDLIQSA